MIYRWIFGLLRGFEPEFIHRLGLVAIRWAGLSIFRPVVTKNRLPKRSETVNTLGLRFDSPVGLAAGFDKSGEAVVGLGALGPCR